MGLSTLQYDGQTGAISLIDSAGDVVGRYPASNNASSSSNGAWPTGTFPFSHYVPHPESDAAGPYGSNGNMVFTVPDRTGMGVHSGRSGRTDRANRSDHHYATEGCVRTTDQATGAIQLLHARDPITTIEISP